MLVLIFNQCLIFTECCFQLWKRFEWSKWLLRFPPPNNPAIPSPHQQSLPFSHSLTLFGKPCSAHQMQMMNSLWFIITVIFKFIIRLLTSSSFNYDKHFWYYCSKSTIRDWGWTACTPFSLAISNKFRDSIKASH